MTNIYNISDKEKYYAYFLATVSLLSVFGNVSWGLYAYYAGIVCMTLYALANRKLHVAIFFYFVVWIAISSVLNTIYDWRIATFGLLILCTTPAISSPHIYRLRKAVMYVICVLLPIVTMLNLYAYSAGINYSLIMNENVSLLQFSGYMTEPLWLGCITGASNVSITYFFISRIDKRKIYRYGLLLLLILSIYLTIVSGSRSALFSSVLGMGTIIYYYAHNKKRFLKYFSVALILTVLLLPFFKSGGDVMAGKMETQTLAANSRSVLWHQRLQEFYSSPIWGIGFATIHRWGRVITGTVETGSGWLTVLSQTGIVGAMFFFLFFKRIKKNLKIIKTSNDLILFAGIFVFLISMSFFEGFIYTIGYVPCFMFWLILGIFYESNKYEHFPKL